MKLHRIQGTGTPIFAILSKNSTELCTITRKLQRSKFKTYIKYKSIQTKADPSTYMTLIAIPEGHNDVLKVKQRYQVSAAKNLRQAMARREKAKALSAYRVAFRNAAYTARILNLAVSAPRSRHIGTLAMVPSVQTMKQNLISKKKPAKNAKNAVKRDAKRRRLMLKIIEDMELC
jgi:hypothetical protein